MKLTLLSVRDYKRTRQIEIAPGDRTMVLVGGRNRQGKSSLLGALSAALGGKGEVPDMAVREGAESAEIRLEFDDGAIVVRRRFVGDRTTLEVTSADGSLKKPQTILDKLRGARFLDPMRFARMDARQQRAALLECVPMELDLDEHDAARAQIYERRTDVNRDAKRLAIELAALPVPDAPPPEVSVAGLLDTARDLRARADAASRARAALAEHNAAAMAAADRLDALQAEASRAREAYDIACGVEAAARVTRMASEDGLRALAAVDVSAEMLAVEEQIRDAGEQNARRAAALTTAAGRARLATALAEAEAATEKLSAAIEAHDQVKERALAAAPMPLPGLTLVPHGIEYQGVPLSQASGAEMLHVSLAVAAAAASELRDIWIEDGSLLDAESMAMVDEFARGAGLRVWLERVGDSDDHAIIIEDGMVRE